ncbi:hypothetical protein EAE96_010698 [Botrytis aclada]|nr:hypothetical protein EAE96_010698 [Botrytis aclada]
MPQHKHDPTRLISKRIPSKVCSSKLPSQLVTSPNTQDDETANTSEEESPRSLKGSEGSICSGDCGKIGGCERKEKSASLEF